ncbi:MAG TPA: sulfatase-like hydrolase/transferase, partial [Acidobacteriota bacterium]|nr:sulfatase-like hydrolase/transferase [Acidobacteriota bacterium]
MKSVQIFLSLLSMLFTGPLFAAQEKANIVYVLVDNWGWGDISIQGGTVRTPRIDQLASEGIRFTNFNV